MSQIRRQSIISSLVIYVAFAIGFLNTYLFTRQGSGFTASQYGLVGIFMAVAALMQSVASLGMNAYITKFFPYYHDHLPLKKNDLFTWAAFISCIGFAIVLLAGIFCKDLVIRKYGASSPEFVHYYNWIFPFGFGLTMFSLFEAYAWQLKKSVLSTYLKELQFRLFSTILIVFVTTGLIKSFGLFIKLYSFTYLFIALILLAYFYYTHKVRLYFSVSKVTRRLFSKIVTFVSFIYGGSLVFTISSVFDTILIAAALKDGLKLAGIYTLAQNLASLVQAPQRGIVSSSIAALSRAWKEKDIARINRIYHSSSINQLIFSIGMFLLIWLNFTDGVTTFHLQSGYIDARWVFFFIGLMRIVDMGTGVNAQIIGTSVYWRFEFTTGVVLLLVTLPLNYYLTKYKFGVLGPAIANLISFTIYNAIRYAFLLRKFKLQPFNMKSLYAITLGAAGYIICFYLFKDVPGFAGLVARSTLFLLIYGGGTYVLKLSPDLVPVLTTFRSKLKRPGRPGR